jgi:hypothetical protein
MHISDRDLKKPDDREELGPDETSNDKALRELAREGRDTYMVAADIEDDEDNSAPGIPEQK